MLSYLNDPNIKAEYIDRMQAHMDADELIRNTGFEEGRGCAVGCTFDDYDHKLYPRILGIPIELGLINDFFFENSSDEIFPTFPIRFLKAIPVGKDLSKVVNRFLIFILNRNLQRVKSLTVIRRNIKNEVVSAIELVIKFHQSVLNGEDVDLSKQRLSACHAAIRADNSIFSSYAPDNSIQKGYSALHSSVYSAANSAEGLVEFSGINKAVYSAARSAYYLLFPGREEQFKEYDLMANKLIELLEQA